MNQENKNSPALCYVAGKSAGHILPCLTRARELIKRYPQYEILFFTSEGILDRNIIEHSSLPIRHVPLTIMNVPRGRWYLLPLFLVQVFVSFCKSLLHLARHKPKQVVTTGGYIAIPVVLAARLLRIPVELQSLDAVPGKALQFLAPFAQAISIVFKNNTQFFPQHKCLPSLYPVRFTKNDLSVDPASARSQLGLAGDRFTLFIIGGSQGSHFLNKFTYDHIAPLNNQMPLQIIHQTGAEHLIEVQKNYQTLNVPHTLFSYSDQLALCYQAADVVICRAGAGTLFEIAFFNKRCLVVPLESASTSHQKDNARAMSREYPELFTVFDQKAIQQHPEIFRETIRTLIHHYHGATHVSPLHQWAESHR